MSFASDDMMSGYYDGFHDDRDEFPLISNRSQAYWHGWLNGRDDRIGIPRASASVLRTQAYEILNSSAGPSRSQEADEESRTANPLGSPAPSFGQGGGDE